MDAQNPYDQGPMDQGYDSYDQGVQDQNGPGWGNARKMNRQQRKYLKTAVPGLSELIKRTVHPGLETVRLINLYWQSFNN